MDIHVNGFQLHYDICGDPAGEPLLWIHGFGGSGADWKYIFKEVPAGYRLIAPDMRGHGASTDTDSNYSFRQSARDVGILLDELKVSRTKAVGLSGGGITLLHLATQQPQRVDAMVVISAPPYFPPQVRAIQRQYSTAMIGDVEMARMRERHRGGNEQIDWIIAQTRTMAETYDDVNFTPPLLGTITARTLIVFGDIDPLYPSSLAFELRTAIPRSSLWVVPNGGHGPVFGPNAPQFVETATTFLRGDWHER
jgi:pimeloyl-ACP methyl ester carboxylesterase